MSDEHDHDVIALMRSELSAMAKELHEHVRREDALIIAAAFPSGDLVAHRIAHEQMMAAAQAETEFWRELRLDIAKKGVVGLLVILLGLLVTGVSFKIGWIK